MTFCLARAELTELFLRYGVRAADGAELGPGIDEVEAAVESRYLRYCDVGDPLQFFTIAVVRSAANTVRLHSRLAASTSSSSPQRRSSSAAANFRDTGHDGARRAAGDDADAEELRARVVLAHRILATDAAIHQNPSTAGFRWIARSAYLWDAVRCVLGSLAPHRPGAPAPGAATAGGSDNEDYEEEDEQQRDRDREAAWAAMAGFFANHDEVLGRGAIHAAVCRATLRAWGANPPRSAAGGEPAFISALRARAARTRAAAPGHSEKREGYGGSSTLGTVESTEATPSFDEAFDDMLGATGMDFDSGFGGGMGDWLFWDEPSQSRGLEFG